MKVVSENQEELVNQESIKDLENHAKQNEKDVLEDTVNIIYNIKIRYKIFYIHLKT